MANKGGITRRSDGRFLRRFNVDGIQYSAYGRTVKECKQKEQEIRKAIEEGTYHTGKEITLDEYFEAWVESKRDTVKESTLRSNRSLYKGISKAVIDKAGHEFGKLKIKEIEAQHVRNLQSALRKEHKSTRTVNDSIYFVKCIFKSAIIDHLVVFNPADGVKPLKRTEEKARDTIHRALTKEETTKFLEYAKDSWYCNLYIFLLNTGCRIGEAGAVLRGDITTNGLNIQRTVTRTETGAYIIGKDTKTEAGKRFIPLNEAAKDALNRQIKINQYIYGDKVVDMTEPIFKTVKGTILKASIVNTDIARICKKAGVNRFTDHAFRDTFATRCVESGMKPKVLQEIMGHTNIEITMNLYAHAMDQTKEQELKEVSFV